MQRTKSKILSILLSLVMLLSLLPTTALAAGNYSIDVALYNNAKKLISLSDKQYLATNGATEASIGYDGTQNYVARYDKSSGTLFLKGYDGVGAEGGIAAVGDLNIKVEHDSSFTASRTSTDNLMGIQASGKLNISGPGKLTLRATAPGYAYGIFAKDGIEISAPLAVTVKKNNTTETGPVYGIYTKGGAISLSGAEDKTITATGGKNLAYGVYAADNSNITISGKLTVSPSDGTFNYGIYTGSGSTITLDAATLSIQSGFDCGIYNNNGNVVIKNSPDVTLNSDKSSRYGIWTNYGGDLTIENSTVKVSANGFPADIKGNVSIQNSTVELTLTSDNYEVIRTGNSTTANTIDLSGSGSVTLTAPGKQEYAMISGKVTATSGTKVEKGTYNSEWKNYKGEYDSANNKTVLKFVHDAPALTANISLDKTGTVDFGSAEAGYTAAPAAETVIITNSGTAATGPLTIALDDATNFTLSKDNISDIAANSTDTFTVQPNIGLPAGIYTATVKVSGTGVTEQSFTVKFTVTAPATTITDSLVTVTDLTGKTYNESAQEPTFGGTLARDTDYTVSYAVKSGSTGTFNSDGKPVGAGTYVVTVAGKGGYTGSFDKDFKIDKADPVYTAPTAKTGLAYTGSALELIKAGTVTKGGEMQYNLSGGTYSTAIPTATDAGQYQVHYKILGNDNYNECSASIVGGSKIQIAPADQAAPTGLGVAAPTTSGGNGKITGTTDKMEYNTDAAATSGWTACFATETEVAPGAYYVRYKADANHNAGTVSAALVVPGYSATKYTVTVTYDANGMAIADKTTDVVAGETITLMATPNSGYVFNEWVDKNPTSLTIGTDGKFTMPGENVSVKATFKPAALTGTASITGDLKYGAELTASLASTNNTGTLTYKWYRGSDEIIGATGSTYTLVEDDIGKTITVKVSSTVQTGEIPSAATAAVDKADGPMAPNAFTLTFTPNSDGTTFTATIPTVAGGEYSFDGTNYSATNTKADCAANSSYTGHVRIAETPTQKASAATSDTKTSPKLTVATPTFVPNGVSSFTGTQSVTISCATVGATIYYTTDGTDPTASSSVYSTALSLTSTTTVKAIAVNAGMNDSAIAMATFTKYSGGGGGGGGSYTPSYTVSVDKTENGTITVSPKSASKGDTVTITVKPDKGYELEMLKALDKDGDALKLTEKNGKYTFKMPSGKVTVKGSFVEEAPVQIFKDVPTDAYYYEAVKWAAEKGITGGVGNGLFAPNQPCTRAQIVTFLWRAAGSPTPKNMSSFTDVPADAFYAKAVAWAVENGITGGTGDGKFSPDATCSRAQAVTFLYRAAGSPKVSGSAEFGDVATNAYYADAVAWAAKNSITGGIGGGLFGSDNDCTRAQIVTFLYRSVK